MKKLKIPQKFTGLARATFEQVKCRDKAQNNLSEPSGTSMGLRQGDASSCTRFGDRLKELHTRGLISLSLYKKQQATGLKKMYLFYTFPPELHTLMTSLF
jgi:hypothetical protein